jgi:MerR family copper efflux transcriptional regulator
MGNGRRSALARVESSAPPAPNAESLTIGALARKTGVSVETVRFYERKGLLEQPARAAGRQRRYSESHLAELRFIRRSAGLGFSLEDIRVLLDARRRGQGGCPSVHAAIHDELADVQAARRMLDAREAKLRDLLGCCAGHATRKRCVVLERLEEDAPGSRVAPSPSRRSGR